MTFLSIKFLVFILVFLIAYKLTEKRMLAQNALIVLGSYVFYALIDWRFSAVLLAVSVFTWLIGGRIHDRSSGGKGGSDDADTVGASGDGKGDSDGIDATDAPGGGKRLLVFGVSVNLLVLCFFKYIGMFKLPGGLAVIMPIGISFYIFEAISYLADSYTGKLKDKHNLMDVLLFLGFFPILISGPIMKAHEFLPQIRREHVITRENLEIGIQRFALGAFMKAAMADRLSVAVNAVYASPSAYSGMSLLWNTLTYTLQLYFDFAGYSNMAIGIATILGFEIKENFNLPYLASSPSDFWKRWHISLSSWITEYIYIPLGGNRKGRARTLANIMIAMLLSGIWHGSTLNFLVWGAGHGLAQVIEKAASFVKLRKVSGVEVAEMTAVDIASDVKKHKVNTAVNALKVVLTFLVVNFLWVPFRTADLGMTVTVFKRIFTNQPGITYFYVYTLAWLIVLVAVEICALLKNEGNNPIKPMDLSTFKGKFVLIILVLLTGMFAYFGNSAFIYGAMF
ncbi:D-alanyl-lipoteichoic acid acyltransferase DltB, MBOAT superfamily [Lachnospiraceae bacterium XBB2008]|nr:D-alanyl-lipoteichoic acid acyltransferase DltB, MBOAT superfamily [Lachnospiraceae bacterium XBB2008]